MALERVHAIIDELGNAPASKTGAVVPDLGDLANEEEEEDEARGKKPRSEKMQRALQMTAQLWKRGTHPWKVSRIYQGNTIIDLEKKVSGNKVRRKKHAPEDAAMEQGRAYVYLHQRSVGAWWSKVDKMDKPPNEQQRRFLKSVIARCQHEYRELNAWNAARREHKRGALTEPSRLCLLGIPGAGKSHCIHLLRDFFETCLQWSDGTQFKFLATQNSMAELIGGGTVHTWGAIPANKALAAMKGKNDKDWDTLWENAMSVRWLVIDECSTLSPGLLATLESFLREKACLRHPYAL